MSVLDYQRLGMIEDNGIPSFLPVAGKANPFGVAVDIGPQIDDTAVVNGAIVETTEIIGPVVLIRCSFLSVNGRW